MREERYTSLARFLHWLTAVAVAAVLVFAWTAEVAPPDDLKRRLFLFHESLGLTVLLLVAVRILWRIRHPAPPLGRDLGKVARVLARTSHWLLYAVFVLMPVSGFLIAGNGRSVSFFGWFEIPGLPESLDRGMTADAVHVAAQWAVYALLLLHLAATVWHLAIRRDGLLDRMLPPQRRR